MVLFGATGMVDQGMLRECLLDPDVETVLAIVRSASLPQRAKLREIVQHDLSDPSVIEARLSGYDACFFCHGVSAVGMKEGGYERVTYDLTILAAQVLAKLNSTTTFI
jgi:putative NADH-flavin reductase